MLYLFIDKNQIKLLQIKKTLLSQYESSYYQKSHQINLQEGQTVNIDLFASAVKEALTIISPSAMKEREVQLILPLESFHFLRAEVPADIAPTALSSFILDKARAQLMIDLDTCLYDYLLEENDVGKQVLFFAINKDLVQNFYEALKLVNLNVTNIVPEVLSYYKLFEKTLRKDKREYILYIVNDEGQYGGYVYDTYGPLEAKRIEGAITATKPLAHQLKKIAQEFETKGKKLNRLILSGSESENIRQDTFTKEVGVWTNPLKRIIPQFYQDYLKLLVTQPTQPIPFLEYDVCIGAFIFSLENKYFSFFKKKFKPASGGSSPGPSRRIPMPHLPWKEIFLFLASFILSFIVLSFVMQTKSIKIPLIGKAPTATPIPTKQPTPSPTPSIKRADINVKVLNGSGIAGKAAIIKDVLTKAGYGDIITDNANNFDYTVSEIQVKKSKAEIIPLIKEDLKKNISAPKVTTLAEKETPDVVIIIGSDIK